jgi:hypothetical protein
MSLAFLLRTAQDQIENQVEEEQKKLKIKFGQEEEIKTNTIHPTNKRTAPGPGKFFAR